MAPGLLDRILALDTLVINAIALYVAIQIVPQLSFDFGNDWWKLGAVALIFALVNSYLKQIVKAISLQVSILTLGLVAFVINSDMLLIVAFGLAWAFLPDGSRSARLPTW